MRILEKMNKTKRHVVEVARLLFANVGVQHTTMNDIAEAAGKGRRTIYTYFKNKEDILNAVIGLELGELRKEIELTSQKDLAPEPKLFKLISVHLNTMRKIVLRNGSLQAEFFRDIWVVEKARIMFDLFEREQIGKILQEGVQNNIFNIPNIETMAYLLQNAIKGMEVPFISGHLHTNKKISLELIQENMKHLILNGIKCDETN